jgi:hypothetical protein
VAHEDTNCCKDLGFAGAAPAGLQQPAECELVGPILVDVRDPQLGLPEKGMIGTLEYLSLLGDTMDNGLQRRTTVRSTEGSGLDVGTDLLDAATQRAEVLQTLWPKEPGPLRAAGIFSPAGHEFAYSSLIAGKNRFER